MYLMKLRRTKTGANFTEFVTRLHCTWSCDVGKL